MNEKTQTGWEEVYKENTINIFKKSLKDNPHIIIKTFAKIPNYTTMEVYKAISDVDIRKQWDTIFSEFKIIHYDPEKDREILYMRIKSPSVFISDRDFVQQRKKWIDFPEKNSICLHFKSVEHPKMPENKKVVRGEIIISGYYIRSSIEDPESSLLTIISQSDIKGNIPSWLVNKVSQKAPRDWVVNLIKGCHIARNEKKIRKL
jgi:hypothetical protein